MVSATTSDFLQRSIVLFCHLFYRSSFFWFLLFLSFQSLQLLSFLPATTTTTLFVRMSSTSTFRRLLKAESEAVLPEVDVGLDALFASSKVRPDAITQRGRRPARARLELADAVLWSRSHVNQPEDGSHTSSLLVECALFWIAPFFASEAGWQSRLAGYLSPRQLLILHLRCALRPPARGPALAPLDGVAGAHRPARCLSPLVGGPTRACPLAR